MKLSKEIQDILNDPVKRHYACERNIYLFSLYYFSHYHAYLTPEFHWYMYDDLRFQSKRGVVWRMFRESAKTAIAKIKIIHNICYQKKRFNIWASYDKRIAKSNCFDIAVELQTNKRILADFGQLFFDNNVDEKKSTKKAIDEFITTNGVKAMAFSTGQSTRGSNWGIYRPDFLVLDDIENLKTADSEAMTQEVIEFFDESITGLSGDANILVLCNNITDVGSIAYIESKVVDDPKWIFRDIPVTDKNGAILWADKYVYTDAEADEINKTIENPKRHKVSLETKKREFGEQVYAREMLNQSITEDEREFKTHYLRYIDWKDVRANMTYNIVTIDTAYSEKKTACRTGICKNYYDMYSDTWNIWAFATRINSADLLSYIFTLHDEGFKIIGVEATAFWAAIHPFFERECQRLNKFPNCVPLNPAGRDKILRIRGLIVPYSNTQVNHIRGKCSELEYEMKAFRGQKNTLKDILDAEAYQLDIIRNIRPKYPEKTQGKGNFFDDVINQMNNSGERYQI